MLERKGGRRLFGDHMKIPVFWHCDAVMAIILPDAPLDPVANHGIADFSRNRNTDAGSAGLPAFINHYKPRAVDRLSEGIKFNEFIPFENAGCFGKCKWLQQNEMAETGWRIQERIPGL